MFGDRPSGKPTKLALAEGGAPLWTAEKACLIDEYIHRFLLVTRHGVYLDLSPARSEWTTPKAGRSDACSSDERQGIRRSVTTPSATRIRHWSYPGLVDTFGLSSPVLR